jgi:hypothetical protein
MWKGLRSTSLFARLFGFECGIRTPAPAVRPVQVPRHQALDAACARESHPRPEKGRREPVPVAAAPEVSRPLAPSDRADWRAPDVLHGPLTIRLTACSTTTTHASARSL